MDDFERRLAGRLQHQSEQVPGFESDLVTVQRRGRNRRWTTRGAGALAALVVIGATTAVLVARRGGEATSELATELTPGGSVTATPTPEPSPTPTPEPLPLIIPTPPIDPVKPDDPDAASLVVATGWGVGLVKDTGDQYAPVVCCEADDLAWWVQEGTAVDGGVIDLGAVSARDDGLGGLVYASRNALFWAPATPVDTADSALAEAGVLLDAQPWVDQASAESESGRGGRLRLWDVRATDDEVEVLYSVRTDGKQGEVRLLSVVAAGAAAPRVRELDSAAWTVESEAIEILGASWLPAGGWMTVKRSAGTCTWIDLSGAPGSALDLVSPYPAAGGCSDRALRAAAVDDLGEAIAVSEVVDGREEIAIYRLSDGAQENRVQLPATAEDQGQWSEIDLGPGGVLVSRGRGMAPDAWPTRDETALVGRDDPDAMTPLLYVGFATWPRSSVSTDGLEALDPRGELWFGARVEASDPAEDTETTGQGAGEAAAATPQPSDTAGDGGESQADPVRVATGHGKRVIDVDALAGANGCARISGERVCVGWALPRASAALDAAFGASERTDDPATFLEGEPHPKGVHVWADDARRVTLEAIDGVVVGVRAAPESPAGLVSPFGADPTMGDVVMSLGPPAEVFVGQGEGTNNVVFVYDTPTGTVSYGYVEFWGDGAVVSFGDGTIEVGGTSVALPLADADPALDDLPVTAWTASIS